MWLLKKLVIGSIIFAIFWGINVTSVDGASYDFIYWRMEFPAIRAYDASNPNCIGVELFTFLVGIADKGLFGVMQDIANPGGINPPGHTVNDMGSQFGGLIDNSFVPGQKNAVITFRNPVVGRQFDRLLLSLSNSAFPNLNCRDPRRVQLLGSYSPSGDFFMVLDTSITIASGDQVTISFGNPPPTFAPTSRPTGSPTLPTSAPTRSPSISSPSKSPVTSKPSRTPSMTPTTSSPSQNPSRNPTTSRPSRAPSFSPSTSSPTASPVTSTPSVTPSKSPSSSSPSTSPSSSMPSIAPSVSRPSLAPTTSVPSLSPSTTAPSLSPSTTAPSLQPTFTRPSAQPSKHPSKSPTTLRTDASIQSSAIVGGAVAGSLSLIGLVALVTFTVWRRGRLLSEGPVPFSPITAAPDMDHAADNPGAMHLHNGHVI